MAPQGKTFTQLVREAWSQEISGWDWKFVEGRLQEDPEPWQYLDIIRQRMQQASSLLEMGTGGGELLAKLRSYPAVTIATEAYPPSVSLAGARLHPLGIQVVQTEDDISFALPFARYSFDLSLNRHAGYSPVEVFRVLQPGGCFITQQVGGRNQIHLNELFQEQPEFIYSDWTLDFALQELQAAGFNILDAREAYLRTHFFDIGAVVFFLKVISWQVPGFTPAQYQQKLRRIHQKIQADGPLETSAHRFIIEAQKA